MAIVDFRSGGFQDAQSTRHAQDYSYGRAGSESHDDWSTDDWDEQRYDQADGYANAGPVPLLVRLSRLTHYFGALVSVGLVVILMVWGFKLVVRDVSGVPVIRAVQGDARTAPADPGGELTDRMGLAVNSVAAGNSARVADEIAIAPKPVQLDDAQDVPMGDLGAVAQAPAHPIDLPLIDETAPVLPLSDNEAAALAAAAMETSVEPDSVVEAIADAPAAEAPVNEALTDLQGREAQNDAINLALAEAQLAAAAPTLQAARPAPRPQRRVAAAQNVASDAAPATPAGRPAAAPAEPAPAKVASGSAMVQIGAFDSDAIAKSEWARVSGKFGGLFDGKSRVVQEAESGGRTFWRLRAAGFGSRDEARKFCAALIAGGIDCIPATAK
ncbi:SPOR domain-containing protein [Paracoccus ravus]|uniref:SPOR domain-containing protein n=1 Tax=Paracoccus ravus TaxID=2447760 RepID=UPI00106E187B|nr:SPOR domain-containing protein [Paracoccus ravus]